MDRIDIQLEVPEFNFLDYLNENAEKSADIKNRVKKALKIQQYRTKRSSGYYNSRLTTNEVNKQVIIDDLSLKMLYKAIEKLNLSPRAYYKVLKISRTIADLEGSEVVKNTHITEALQYRIFDRINYNGSDFNRCYVKEL